MFTIINKLNNTKGILILTIIIISIIICITIISFVFFPTVSTSTIASPTASQPTSIIVAISQAMQRKPFVTPAQFQDTWNTYKAGTYSIQYPQLWSAGRDQDGHIVTLQPNNSDSNFIPFIQITVNLSPTTTPAIDERIYTTYGFRKSAITIHKTSFIKLNGSIPPVNNTPRIQETVVYTQKGNATYIIQYQYPAELPVSNVETLFSQIISTFYISQ